MSDDREEPESEKNEIGFFLCCAHRCLYAAGDQEEEVLHLTTARVWCESIDMGRIHHRRWCRMWERSDYDRGIMKEVTKRGR
jgi:hypothetical protein